MYTLHPTTETANNDDKDSSLLSLSEGKDDIVLTPGGAGTRRCVQLLTHKHFMSYANLICLHIILHGMSAYVSRSSTLCLCLPATCCIWPLPQRCRLLMSTQLTRSKLDAVLSAVLLRTLQKAFHPEAWHSASNFCTGKSPAASWCR